jgi:outer membrane autotransporter protein
MAEGALGNACFASFELRVPAWPRFAMLILGGLAGTVHGQTCTPGPVSVNGTACTVTPGSTVTLVMPAQNALYALNTGARITADDVTVQLGAVLNARGLRAEGGGVISFNRGSLSTTGTGVNAAGQVALYALGAGSEITGTNVSILVGPATGNSAGNIGILADGGRVALQSSTVTTRGAGAVGGNMGLNAVNAGVITFTGGAVTTNSTNSAGVLAQTGGQVSLSGGTLVQVSGQTVLNAVLGSHGLQSTGAGSLIKGSGIQIVASGARSDGALAENGGTIELTSSIINTTGAGATDTNPAGALVVRTGGSLTFEGAGGAVTTHASRNSGLDARGAGAVAHVSDATLTIGGTRSRALAVFDGAVVDVSRSSVTANGVSLMAAEVGGSGSSLTLSDTGITATNATAYGLRTLGGATASVTNGSISTQGVNAPGIAVGTSTVTASGVAVLTSGNENAMGVLADLGGTITLTGGSVTTTGDAGTGSRVGSYPHALTARNPGGTLISSGTAILTTGAGGMGGVSDDGGSLSLSGNRIETRGDSSLGLYATVEQAGGQFAAAVSGTQLTITTSGVRAYGAQAQQHFLEAPATMTLSDTAITTRGEDATGLRALSAGTVLATRTTVATEGVAAHGALARSHPSSVTLIDTTLATAGPQAHGAVAETGGRITGTRATITPTGSMSSALFAVGDATGVSIASFTDSTLANSSGATIGIAGPADVSLTGTGVSGSGLWLHVGTIDDFPVLSSPEPPLTMPSFDLDNPEATLAPVSVPNVAAPVITPGLGNVQASGATLTGAALTEAGSVSNVTLRDDTLWNLTGDSNLTNLVNDPSRILFSAPVNGVFKTLTVVNYVGEGQSLIGLNTVVAGDGSPSDKLVIDGGSATGQSQLAITNVGGTGALTRVNGILVIDAINAGTTVPTAFTLAQGVAAGPYTYSLVRGSRDGTNAQAWYLRSTIDCGAGGPVPPCPSPPVPPPPEPPAPPGPPAPPAPPGPAPIPNYRAEASLYTALPALALRYGWATLGNLHERVGEEEQLRDRDDLRKDDTFNGSWVRVIGESGDVDGDRRGIYGSGPHYDYDIRAIQLGLDVYAREHDNAQRDHAGLYLGYGRITSDVTHYNDTKAGRDEAKGPSLGLYWTHYWDEGEYLDAVWQGTWMKATSRSVDSFDLEHRGFGWAASLEGGYPFHKDTQVFEPQAQVVYQAINDGDAQDGAAMVRYRDADSLAARLGFRWANTWTREPAEDGIRRLFTGWLRLNLWREFKGRPITEFSSAEGYVPFKANMHGSWWQLNGGMSWQLNRQTSFYANLGYQRGFGRSFAAWDGKLGFRWNW